MEKLNPDPDYYHHHRQNKEKNKVNNIGPNNHNNNENNGNNNENNNSSHKSQRRSSNSHISMSDTESQGSQLDSYYSPLRSESPLRSDDPAFQHSPANSKALVAVGQHFSPIRSPLKPPSSEHLSFQTTPGTTPPVTPPEPATAKGKKVRSGSPAAVYNYNRATVKEGVTKVGRGDEAVGEAEEGAVGGEKRSRAAVASILRRSKKDVMLRRAALGFRVCEAIVCLISFSVLAADKTQGWAGDSWDRYKEYRYCLAVNVIGFAYAVFQSFVLSYQLATGEHLISHYMHYHFDFLMDQILAYLLMSASSSAATRVDDWVSNWGKDAFTEMATASIGMSFLGFFAFAVSSLISGYSLCNRDSN